MPKRFAFTYPHDVIAEAVKRLSRVKDAEVERVSRTALAIAVREYLPVALWCEPSPPEALAEGGEGCVFISEEGVAFAKAPPLSGAVILRYFTEGRTPEVGQTLADAEYISATQRFTETLRARHGISIQTVTETKDGDVRYGARDGGEFLVTRDADLNAILENTATLLASEEFSHLRAGSFQYIDLRFGNKIFVKETATPESPNEPQAFTPPPKTDDTENP